MKERVKWIDTAKFLGIFAIYLGHFCSDAGNAYSFVFRYHVAFFFLLSGFTSTYDNDSIGEFIVKKIKTIMIPFWLFSILSIVLHVILYNLGIGSISSYFIIVLKGAIRDSFFAASLWFLTCLFLMEIIFKLLKFLKFKWLIFLICFALFIVAAKLLNPPGWWYNLDYVFGYIIYFAIGYCVYPLIVNLFKLDTLLKKIIFVSTGIICLIFSALIFFGRFDIASLLSGIPFINMFASLFRALIIIWLNLIIAKMIENISLFNEIGKNTLYLCGSEYAIKSLMRVIVSIVSLKISIDSPLAAYLYTFFLLVIGAKLIAPIERKVLNIINQNLTLEKFKTLLKRPQKEPTIVPSQEESTIVPSQEESTIVPSQEESTIVPSQENGQ